MGVEGTAMAAAVEGGGDVAGKEGRNTADL